MLQALVRMRDVLLQRNFRKKKIFRFFNFPNADLRRLVDYMLIK